MIGGRDFDFYHAVYKNIKISTGMNILVLEMWQCHSKHFKPSQAHQLEEKEKDLKKQDAVCKERINKLETKVSNILSISASHVRFSYIKSTKTWFKLIFIDNIKYSIIQASFTSLSELSSRFSKTLETQWTLPSVRNYLVNMSQMVRSAISFSVPMFGTYLFIVFMCFTHYRYLCVSVICVIPSATACEILNFSKGIKKR